MATLFTKIIDGELPAPIWRDRGHRTRSRSIEPIAGQLAVDDLGEQRRHWFLPGAPTP